MDNRRRMRYHNPYRPFLQRRLKRRKTMGRRIFSGRPGAGGTITEGVIWKPLLAFFFPILLGTFFQQLYNTADAIIVGKFVGKQALAAVGGSTSQIINLIVGFFVGLASGASVIISQYFGARDDRNVSRTVHTAAALSLAGGVLITVLGIVLAPAMLRMMNTPEDVVDYSLSYIRIYFLGTVPSLIYNIGSGILRAIGDSRRPLIFLIVACMTNIVLDVVAVLGLNMGVAGAALATILSQTVSAVLVLLTLLRTGKSYRVVPRQIRFHPDLLKNTLRIGLPAGIQSVLYTVSNIIIQTSINGFGTDAAAAWSAYSKLDCVFWMVINAFGISITTFAGQNFGAGKIKRMRRSVWVCAAMAAAGALMVSGVLLAGAPVFYGLFSDDQAVIDLGVSILNRLAPFYITYVLVEVLSGAVRGAGDALMPMLMSLFGVCVLRMVWLLGVVPRHNELLFMLLCYPITWSATSLMFLVYYLKGGWLKRCLKKAGVTPVEEP